MTTKPKRNDSDLTDPHMELKRVPGAPLASGAGPSTSISSSSRISSMLSALGPIQSFLKDPAISEIMINDLRNIMIEREGKLQFSGYSIQSKGELELLVNNILKMIGQELTQDRPYVDAMLPDGSRVNIIGPPVAVGGFSITIRKFPTRQLKLDDLVAHQMLDQKMAYFLSACVAGKINLLISGGTDSGKTTFLNALFQCIPNSERVITIEDTPELVITHANSVRLQTQPKTPSQAEITARELVANSLRMRPDRIIVGECRRAEAFDMLQAMNTGHSGSMTTIHANSTRDALARLETLCLMAQVELPVIALRKQVTSALDIIVQLKRFRNGTRRVTAISEITGMESEIITMQDIFTYDGKSFRCAGIVPTLLDRMKDAGIELAANYFA